MFSEVSKIFGLAGASLIILAIAISAFCYIGRDGERYSLLNHFISELGEVGVSPAARVFNWGLTIGGLLMLPYMVGLGLAFHSPLGWMGTLAGVISSLGVAAVGWYPVNNFTSHVRAALTYFRAGLVMVIFFALAIIFQPTPVLPPAVNLLSLVTGFSYASFLLLLRTPPEQTKQPAVEMLDVPPETGRPQIWWVALLEWVVFFTTIAWIFGVAALG